MIANNKQKLCWFFEKMSKLLPLNRHHFVTEIDYVPQKTETEGAKIHYFAIGVVNNYFDVLHS
jgi:hypothetical protein